MRYCKCLILNSRISANHDKVEGFQQLVKFLWRGECFSIVKFLLFFATKNMCFANWSSKLKNIQYHNIKVQIFCTLSIPVNNICHLLNLSNPENIHRFYFHQITIGCPRKKNLKDFKERQIFFFKTVFKL